MGKPPFHPGDKVNDYVIEQQVNVGSMGAVYTIVGEDILLKAPFIDSKKVIDQFRKEVETLSQLEHSGILGILEKDLKADIPWYTIEEIQEKTLRSEIVHAAPLTEIEATTIILKIAEALAYGHNENCLHGSLLPENIGFKDNEPILLDFGLGAFGTSSGIMTAPNSELLYKAPEELGIIGKKSQQAEVYTLGVLYYELLTSNLPFGNIEDVCYEEQRVKYIEDILDNEKNIPLPDNIDEVIKDILEKALRKDKSLRYNNAQEMTLELKNTLKNFLYQEAERYRGNENFEKAIHTGKKAIVYGLDESYLENLQAEYDEKSNIRFGELEKTSLNFTTSLSSMLEIIELYSEEKKDIWEKLLHKALGISNEEDWEKLLENLIQLYEGTYNIVPKDIKENLKGTLQNFSQKTTLHTKEDGYNPQVIAEEPYDEDDMPTAIMPQVDTQEDSTQKDAITTIPSVSENANFDIVVVDNSVPEKELPGIKLPSYFYWKDENTIICEKDNSEMLYIPAGVFIMGSETIHAFECEKPEREVYLDHFFIDKYPITWKQFEKYCQDTGKKEPKYPRWGRLDDHPVVNLSWEEAEEYCFWAGKFLPTEAQWEKAARGGVWLDGDEKKEIKNNAPRRKYPWGDESPNADRIWRANYNAEPTHGKNKGKKSTSPVGYYSEGVSPYNVYDMAGNVWEWSQDWYSENYYKENIYKNPQGPSKQDADQSEKEKPAKILRGGSWYIGSRLLRVSARRKRTPDGRGASCGMRCALNLGRR